MLTNTQHPPVLPQRVIVLGANGFIARHLSDWCILNGLACRAIGSQEIDLSDRMRAQDLAGILRPGDAIVMTSMLTPEKGRDRRAVMVNLHMVETVCLALERAPCAHFVYLSSDAVYDAHQIPLDEDSSREPVDLYALSHTAREMMLSSDLENRKIPYCILRLTNIYGPGDTHNAYGPNRFVRTAVHEGRIELFGQGEERRSHVFIDDLVRIVTLALAYRSVGTLNMAARPAVSFRDIADSIARMLPTSVRIDSAPRVIRPIHRPYKLTQVFRFIYNLGRPIGPIVHRTFMNTAVFTAFPEFSFTPVEQGLKLFIEAERSLRRTSDATEPSKRVLAASSSHE